MLHALRTELAYFRVWLLGALGIAAFVVVLLSLLVRFLKDGDGPPTFVAAMFPLLAGMVVSFIAQSYRVEERRARLLLAGPLTPRQLGGVTVLLPVCFAGLCALAEVPMIALASLIAGKFEPTSLFMVAGFGLQFLAYAQLGPLAQESTAARRQRRNTAAIAGWGVFAGAIPVLTAAQFFLHSLVGQLGVVAVVFVTAAVALRLYEGRTDFTR